MTEQEIIEAARAILLRRMKTTKAEFNSPGDTRDYLQLTYGAQEREHFSCLYLDNKHRLIEEECLFQGTIDGASVWPREVVKGALKHNAAAVILAHNHPSGVAEPSRADQAVTQRIKDALALVDIRLLDHFVVCADDFTSLAEQGHI